MPTTRQCECGTEIPRGGWYTRCRNCIRRLNRAAENERDPLKSCAGCGRPCRRHSERDDGQPWHFKCWEGRELAQPVPTMSVAQRAAQLVRDFSNSIDLGAVSQHLDRLADQIERLEAPRGPRG